MRGFQGRQEDRTKEVKRRTGLKNRNAGDGVGKAEAVHFMFLIKTHPLQKGVKVTEPILLASSLLGILKEATKVGNSWERKIAHQAAWLLIME